MVAEEEAREEMAHKARETQQLADKLLNKQELGVARKRGRGGCA